MSSIAAAAGAPQIALSLDNAATDRATDRLLSSVVAGSSTPGPAMRLHKQRSAVWASLRKCWHTSTCRPRSTPRRRWRLAESGIEVPELSTYASVLWDFWEQNLDPAIRADRATRAAVKGSTIVITGATSGIGKASALRLAALGAHVILVARGVEALDLCVDEIKARGGTASAYPCDLADLDAIDELVKNLSVDFERIDFMVNNARRSIRRSLRLSYGRFHDYERTMQLNYFGAIRLVMGLTRHGQAARRARRQHLVDRRADQCAEVLGLRRLQSGTR